MRKQFVGKLKRRFQNDHIYLSTRRVELSGNSFGIRRRIRTDRGKTAQRVDYAVSGDHSGDELDWVPISFP